MKIIFALFITFILANISFAQDAKDTKQKSGEPVSTIGYIEKAESKSGYGINGFYIQLTKDEYEKYYDRKIEVSGKLLIVEGLTDEELKTMQGSKEDRYFIEETVIKIIE
ncbi:MAG: hypothetical protein J0M18_05850 [Ignavibacteria bacterium]|jgi:hypothetical protein|nr:hypothetical protein [Ignavibacteria bacterium]